MKRIFIPFFAAAALLASCSDWTEAEHKDFLPPMNQNDPAFLTSLRDFKVGEHLVTMMIVRGTSTAPNRQNQHPMSMPDSVDYLLMTDVDDLHPALSDEIAEVRSKKGTRTLNVVDYTTIRSTWDAMKEASFGTEHEGDYTEEKFAEYCKAETESSLRPAPDTDSTASSSPIWAVTTAAPQLRSSWRRTRGAATIPTSYSSSADTPPSSRASRTRRFLRSVTTSSS